MNLYKTSENTFIVVQEVQKQTITTGERFYRQYNGCIVCKTEQPPQYECDHCGKVTSSRAAIAKHLEIHGDKKFACDVVSRVA